MVVITSPPPPSCHRQQQTDTHLKKRRTRKPSQRRQSTLCPTGLFKLGITFLLSFLVLSSISIPQKHENSGHSSFSFPVMVASAASTEEPLLLSQISQMRVRDLKRRLTREHGYSANELSKMLDKKDLIEALAFEEHKVDQRRRENAKRKLTWNSIKAAVACVAVVMFWPLIRHSYEVGHVNFVVYTDKKKYEISRCRELQSYSALFGIFLIFIMDLLSLWLTTSVLLSWVMRRNKYFFPIPSLTVRPAAIMSRTMGQTNGGGPLGQYGMNVGPMVVTWCMRWLNGRIEQWMGKQLSKAVKFQQKQKRKEERKVEKKERKTQEEKEARRQAKADRKKEREARKAAEAEAHEAEEKRKEMVEKATKEAQEDEKMNEFGTQAFPSKEEARKTAAAAAEARRAQVPSSFVGTEFDDLD